MEATLPEKLSLFIVLIVSLSVHEWAHAFVADKMGDDTPRLQGRLTLNPLAHIDFIGTLFIPLTIILLAPGFAILGWARPVMIDPRNFKKPIQGDVLTSLAGPVANILLALVISVAFGLLIGFTNNIEFMQKFAALGLNIVYLNILLFIFNLLPVPPLDGSHLMRHIFGIGEEGFARFSQWGVFILIILINIEFFNKLLMASVQNLSQPLAGLMEFIAGTLLRVTSGA